MVDVVFTDRFEKELRKSDNSLKERARKQIEKIIENPETGKPLRYNLKGERAAYSKPFRIIYSFDRNTIYFLRFEHRKEVYQGP
jgi:mRNA-degrading endonuclease RelE of RelBE toxin-antitoxin system